MNISWSVQVVQKGDTLNSLAEKFAIKDGAHLRAFHNLYCALEDLLEAEVAAGKWSKTYDKIKILDKKCVTEISKLKCSTGGKITILKHGQQSQSSKSQVKKANPREQHLYNPIMNFEEFQEEISSKNNEAW
ncbi:DUF4280 domain-containing protein [Flavobacterium columnare]|uniref:DUF4280 domain-containing protein n=1 Tax=Flavobacterium columnare (strain ATCC 49512 / CIP 103533 / TG 44/87) TaxID=1041826 RepID=G8X7J4_FLACA|nr:PAAR-like protein [Flavobacterium columnare]AEW85707.1 hypothetical protein FCOL_04365 [Flavobacterium columnare ATCC 49512]QOG89512.1 DUF4280 domain-containing protein [Flavobacterium columnare]QOG92171.1 DUF4280 domain-containing protein [Flavobacterium columnare]QOG94835.1 DUF4280 domain-containing protein [Flavobacterium columnare]QOG97494.1 DUF4280 domain-containing protein [Flavobacterium columnare]